MIQFVNILKQKQDIFEIIINYTANDFFDVNTFWEAAYVSQTI